MNRVIARYIIIFLIGIFFCIVNYTNANDAVIKNVNVYSAEPQTCIFISKIEACKDYKKINTLQGLGYIELTISDTKGLIQDKIDITKYNLNINGVNLLKDEDVKLIGFSFIENNSAYLLKYKIINGENTINLFSSIYSKSGLNTSEALQVSLQSSDILQKSIYPKLSIAKIRVTTESRIDIAFILSIVIIAIMFIIARYTSVLRDNISNPDFDQTKASYSLTKVQLAAWFSFTIIAGVFLWVIFGSLPKIDGTVLFTLLALSGGITIVNNLSDQQKSKPDCISKGFWIDITTGFDDEAKIYRYQMVLANITLLTIGIYDVVNNLKFPNFPDTWLVFLGASAAYYGFGRNNLNNSSGLNPNPNPNQNPN